MAYLVKNHPDQLFFIDHTSHNGLFYKIFSSTKSVRTNILYSTSTEHFAATKDQDNGIHIACKNRYNQIIHLYQKNSIFESQIILDDTDNKFKISNLRFLESNNDLHLFYTALNPNDNTTDIIQHRIHEDAEPPRSVISTTDLESNYECIHFEDKIFLLSMNKESNDYELQLSYYDPHSNQWEYADTLASSSHPITTCNMCIDDKGIFHILYVQNQFGQYVTNYLQYNDKDQGIGYQVHTCPFNISPVIFVYDDNLWINWIENNELYMKLSTDSGESFTDPRPCSLHDNEYKPFTYLYDKEIHKNLFGNRFYGSVENYPKIAILHQLDMDSIHLDQQPNQELKLFVSTLKHTYKDTKTRQLEKILRENDELKEIQKRITLQYEDLSKLAEKLQKEGKKWRSKYYSAEIELKSYKKKLQNNTNTNTTNTNPLNDS